MSPICLKIKKKNIKRIHLFISICLVLLIFLAFYKSLNEYQHSRYKKDVYDCTEMTQDCEFFFEGLLGIHCLNGIGYNPGKFDCHQWLVLDIGGIWLEWESTGLYFKDISSNYEVVKYNEGFIL